MFSNFNTKIIREVNFGKTSKKFVKVQVSTIHLKEVLKSIIQLSYAMSK